MKNITIILVFLGGFAFGVLATNVWFWIRENRDAIEAAFFGVVILLVAITALASQRNNRGGRL